MNKVKSPFVKVLRKAGFSTKEAMDITLDAQFNFSQQHQGGIRKFNSLAVNRELTCMFSWGGTPQGHRYWWQVEDKLLGVNTIPS